MSSAAILTTRLKEEQEYWLRRLSDGLGNSSLSPDFKRSRVFSRKVNTIPVSLPDEVGRLVLAFTKNSPFLIYTTLMAALKTCLWNYTGSATIVVGSPSYRKDGDDAPRGALPIVDHLEGNLSFRELLLNVRRTLSEAYEHQSYPLARMVQDLKIEEDPTGSALFDVALVLEDIHHELPEVRNGITFRFNGMSGLIVGSVEYNARYFRRDTIEGLAKHLVTILRTALTDVERPISRLPLLDDEEREQLWNACNNVNRDYSPDACVIQMFETQTDRSPDALAVAFQERSLTYGELNARANQVAHTLRRLGVGPECIVGLSIDRSLEMIIAIVGILKAGGAYLPLDPSLPESRLAFMLADARANAVLTLQRHREKFGSVSQTVICLDSDWHSVLIESRDNPISETPSDSGAYVLFTSGSTGQPKGVMMTRRPLANLISWQLENTNTTAGSRTLQFASLSFDVSFQEIFSTLCAGECLVLITEELRRDPASLWRLLGDEAVERIFLPFIYLQQLADAAAAGPGGQVLRDVITAGEQLQVTPSVVELFRQLPGCLLVNQYGPTEAHVVSGFTLSGAPSRWPTLPPIGFPIANARVYLLDSHLRAVPAGVPGELYLGGVSIARCYLNRPELSAEKFVPHPYSRQGGERLYKTGDLGRYLSDGNIEYLGRLDHQVKIRGFRVEIGEIEVALNTHSAVRECAVLAREDTPGDKRLAAYVVANREKAPSSSELRLFLKEKLPEYMVPSSFVILDSLPLTRTGKIDRKALPAPSLALAESDREIAMPRTHVEETLAGIWAEVLGVSQVGVHDNFFELGGDSILTIQVVARANRAGLRLVPKQLFQHQTIAEVAAVADTAPVIEAEQGAVTGPVPLTPIQHWFFNQELPDPNHFNMGYLFEWRSSRPPVPAMLEQSVRALMAHHDALRLRFTRTEDGWREVNAEADHSQFFTQLDLSGVDDSEISRKIEAAATALQSSLSLSDGPLIRAALFDLGSERAHRLLILIHHLAVDGVSWRILVEDFQTAYKQLESGEAVNFPPKTTSFKQWSERLSAHAQSDLVRQELAYWLREPLPPFIPLPVDNLEGDNNEASADISIATLSAEETEALLRAVPKFHNLRINDILLAALAQAFSRWTSARSLWIDLESHGREDFSEDMDVSRTVGWFTSISPICLDLRDADTPGQVLTAVKEQLRRIPNRGIGYGLMRYLSEDRATVDNLRALPTAQVSFNYLGQTDQLFNQTALLHALSERIGSVIAPSGLMPHLLYVAGIIFQGQLYVRFKYSKNCYNAATIESLAESFQEELRALISYCQSAQPVADAASLFPLAQLDGAELEAALSQVRLEEDTVGLNVEQVETIYPLSPSQQGILFHSVYSPESGVYVIQMHCTFRGLDVSATERAWQFLMDRYPILRTAFVWENVAKPLQIVATGLNIKWRRLDWRSLSRAVLEERFDAYLEEDRSHGFKLSNPPLMRFSLIRTGDDEYKLVWSHHHLLLDGWSIFIILKEFLVVYDSFVKGETAQLSLAQPYSDYISWLQGHDVGEAESFWREMLTGINTATPVGRPNSANGRQMGYAEHRSLLSEEDTSALQAFAKQHQLTLNTVVQGAWSMLLSHYSGLKDVVFGATASGRPPELPGVESMVGIFINVVPMRVRLDSSERVSRWLKGIQDTQFRIRQYEYSPLVQIQRWSEVPRGRPLFESILSFENYPIDNSISEYAGDLDISDVHSISRTNYPITVVVAPRKELVLRMAYDRDRFNQAMIEEIAENFAAILRDFVSRPEAAIGAVQDRLGDNARKQRLAEQRRHEEAKRSRFKGIKPKAVGLPQQLIKTSHLNGHETLPLVIEPVVEKVNVVEWVGHNREFVEAGLHKYGALLLRGFNVDSVDKFQQVATAICPELFGEYGDLPREGVNGKVYGSTPYPSTETILFHNESSHMHRWPMKIWFYCVQAARQGGETPIIDCREVYRRLDARVRDRFAEKRLMYVRNYIEGLDVSWQSFFRTEKKSDVEDYCRKAGIDFEWTSGNGLRTRKICPAVARHPRTNELVFFNQIQLHHISCLDRSVRETLALMYSNEGFPRNVYYGDGSPIEDSLASEICDIYRETSVSFPWREGDILMLDNMLTAHARNPYVGPRRIVVAMGELLSENALACP